LTSWPATALPRAEAGRLVERVLAATSSAPVTRGRNAPGPGLLLDWLEGQPGVTWQERWVASGASGSGAGWRAVPARWLEGRGHRSKRWLTAMSVALRAAVCADVVRPSMRWLIGGMAAGHFAGVLAAERDPAGFAGLRELL